MEEKNVSETK